MVRRFTNHCYYMSLNILKKKFRIVTQQINRILVFIKSRLNDHFAFPSLLKYSKAL